MVENILPPQESVRYPICLKGIRACPPEDVGGVWGYENFLEAILNPEHNELEEYLNWVGGEFDLDSPWHQSLPEDPHLVDEELAVRQYVITLLSYLRDNKVTGTQSTGNLPLRAVREICVRFVNPPKLEEAIGEHVYRVLSETEVWPLHFRHILVAVGGIVTGGPSRRWKLAPLGEHFLAAPSPLQVWLLLATWWTQTNWAIASPYDFEDSYMPPGFSRLAPKHLLVIPLGELACFAQFADRMIADSRMVWLIEDQGSAQRILRSIIERTVINPLVDFGILQSGYEPHLILGAGFCELSTFRVEVAAAIGRAGRMKLITPDETLAAMRQFRSEWDSFQRLPITENTVIRGDVLAFEHNLRGYHATHLACALIWQEMRGIPITLASFDSQLIEAASVVQMAYLSS